MWVARLPTRHMTTTRSRGKDIGHDDDDGGLRTSDGSVGQRGGFIKKFRQLATINHFIPSDTLTPLAETTPARLSAVAPLSVGD